MKNNKLLIFLFKFFIVILFLSCVYIFIKEEKPRQDKLPKQVESVTLKQKTRADLPKVTVDDWQLLLVNKEHKKEDLQVELADINGFKVDKRIADATAEFLAAAQAIDPQEHILAAYRSLEEQNQLYHSYVEQEIANNPSLNQEAAEALVQAYFPLGGASEHQTGLAIDMSTVDALNQSDQQVVKKVAEVAPKYGFVLRFPEDKKDVTGRNYEDWHYRYVGKKSAQYMTKNHLSLEEYLAILKEKK
ncbi:D-alanyl-D-alanine carboxypeptidase family protein [Streptococcus didelphis]|uniref:M15 family metallopeptidase n=1 Tax=Streptococcus didelphis TaxID=102886 RepID=UPI000360FB81|nr:D-alanyl-D-alanine carboxypeptidase family protein [Streptococcus didelphis]WMB29341.1 D-alanyl-D-alanine carboxypeptidase family protein [Streptococcus didelphis]